MDDIVIVDRPNVSWALPKEKYQQDLCDDDLQYHHIAHFHHETKIAYSTFGVATCKYNDESDKVKIARLLLELEKASQV